MVFETCLQNSSTNLSFLKCLRIQKGKSSKFSIHKFPHYTNWGTFGGDCCSVQAYLSHDIETVTLSIQVFPRSMKVRETLKKSGASGRRAGAWAAPVKEGCSCLRRWKNEVGGLRERRRKGRKGWRLAAQEAQPFWKNIFSCSIPTLVTYILKAKRSASCAQKWWIFCIQVIPLLDTQVSIAPTHVIPG